MTFRTRLMLAMAPLVLALAAVGVVSGLVARALARQPGLILADNYRSVLAAQRMKEAVERVDQSVLLELLGQSRDAAGLDQHVAQFEHELAAEAENITEAGEQEAVDEARSRRPAQPVAPSRSAAVARAAVPAARPVASQPPAGTVAVPARVARPAPTPTAASAEENSVRPTVSRAKGQEKPDDLSVPVDEAEVDPEKVVRKPGQR